MPRYIDADKLIEWAKEFYPEDKVFVSAIKNAPTANVREAIYGKWIAVDGDIIFRCSKCDAEVSTSWDYEDDNMFKYCPCCGAKMENKE